MKIQYYQDVRPTEDLPGVFKREVVNARDGAPNFTMRLFEIQPGKSTPSHSHPWEHEIFIISGECTAVSGGKETKIGKDFSVFVPPNEHHAFINSGKEVLRLICVIPN